MEKQNSSVGTVKEIRIRITLDEQQIPEQICWEADDAGPTTFRSKAVVLGMWDESSHDGMHLNLWTKQMTVEELGMFVFQVLVELANMYRRATQDEAGGRELMGAAHRFARWLGQAGRWHGKA
ncbi:MAG: hypothetical protein NZL95_08920 [Chitinophagales bacterium]|nr:hypothetical protein [Chitinophagales bacterium]MDW8428658.1 hypothetical protein [Chitinophagales bacterium]